MTLSSHSMASPPRSRTMARSRANLLGEILWLRALERVNGALSIDGRLALKMTDSVASRWPEPSRYGSVLEATRRRPSARNFGGMTKKTAATARLAASVALVRASNQRRRRAASTSPIDGAAAKPGGAVGGAGGGRAATGTGTPLVSAVVG